MRHQPGPALFVTTTMPGRLTPLRVWTSDGHLAGRSDDLGMAAAITNAAIAKHGSALISGEDGRCLLVTTSSTGLTVEPLSHDDTTGWPTSLSRALNRLTSQPTLPPPSPSTGGHQ